MADYTVQDLQDNLNYLNETKRVIKEAIKEKGQPITDKDTFRSYADKITNIETGIDTSDATATAEDIISPKTAYVDGQKITGKIIPYGEASSNTINHTQYVENTPYYIYDICERHNLVLLSQAPISGSTTFYVGVYDDEFNINIVSTTSFTGTTTYKKINNMKFSKVDNALGYVNIFIDANGGWNGATYFQIIAQFDWVNNKIVTLDEFQRSRTGGDQSVVNIIPHPKEDGTYILCCNRSVNAPDGLMLVKYNAVGHTCSEYSYYAGIGSSGRSRGSGQWNKAGTKFLWLSNAGHLSTSYEIYSYNLGGTSLIRSVSNKSKSSNTNLCWYTDELLLYGSNVCDINLNIQYSISGLSFNTSGAAYNLNNDGSIVIFSNGNTMLVTIDIENNAALTYKYGNAYYNWTSGNENMNCMLLYQPSVENNLWYWYNTEINKIYIEGEFVITSLVRNGLKYVNIQDSSANSSDLLQGKIAYNRDGKITGTMPDNSNSEFIPSDSDITLPKGYMSNSIIKAVDITTLSDYQACEAIADNILGDTKPYTRLEYIESTGTQWIDTGYIPNDNTKYEITLSDVDGSRESTIFGTGAYVGNQDLLVIQGREIRWYYYTNYLAVTSNYTSKNLITLYRGTITCNGTTISSQTRENTSTNTSNLYIYKCAGNTLYASYKLYSFKVYENNILVRDFIPVKDLGGRTALYDLIESKFYYNGGSGDFIAGGVI